MRMPLVKNKIHFLLLSLFFQIGFAQDLFQTDKITINQLNGAINFSPSLITVSNKQIFLLDKKSRILAKINNDSLNTVGGFGGSRYGMFDPVDLIADQLDIFVLEQGTSKISRFDFNLNLIQTFPLSSLEPKYPPFFNIDSKRNILFYSPEDGILFKTESISNKFFNFIDFNLLTDSYDCLLDIAISRNDQCAVIFSCTNELLMFNRNGSLTRRFKLNIKNPFKVSWFDNNWAVFNDMGQLEFQNAQILNIDTEETNIIDIAHENNLLYVLTDSIIKIIEIPKIPF